MPRPRRASFLPSPIHMHGDHIRMKRIRLYLLLALAALLLPHGNAQASLSAYTFNVSTGSEIVPPSWTNIWAGYQRSRGSIAYQTRTLNLPFAFKFDCVDYTQITMSSFGLIAFGGYVYNDWYNNLNGTGSPVITPLWDNIYVGNGGPGYCNYTPAIRYGVSGSPGSRIFVIDFFKVSRGYCDGCQFGPTWMDYQVRLYEGSNKIEFHYLNANTNWPSCIANRWGSSYTNTSASIGISASYGDYMSITPSGSSATMSRTSVNDYVDLQNNRITANSLYTFTPPSTVYTGNVAQGGVANMASGAILMTNISVQRGSSQTFQPFSISLPTVTCAALNLTAAISGVNAGDFTVSPVSTTLNPGGTQTYSITFTPQSVGVRTATLTLNDQFGVNRVYTLRATGSPRVSWTPNLAQGGTPTLTSGDTLMKDFIARRAIPKDFTPITLQNFSTNGSIPPAVITVSIDSAGGISRQYSLVTPSTVSLGPGQSHTPIIRFTGIGLGPQNATITINADGEIRSFPMKVISGAPTISVSALNVPVDPANPLFHQVFSCVGDAVTSIPVQVTNPGHFPLLLNKFDVYAVDTTERQGAPPFPMLRDAQGNLIPVKDYILTASPGVAPLGANTPLALPISVDPGTTRTIYATFVGQIPGKRFGRAFLRTNAENIFGTDTTGPASSVLGLLTFDIVGRAIGSQLKANPSGLALKTVVFPGTRVGDTSVTTFTVSNTGACDLRINRNKLRIYAGDVNEFKMLTSLRNTTLDAVSGDYIIAPGMVDTITVRFTPSRAGTRMATLWIQTNDSTMSKPGLVERGAYYLDLTGRGLAGLDAHDLVLDPVVIGSYVNGVATLENTLNTTVPISSITFMGDDAAEFSENASNPWPARPINVLAGEKLQLGVRLTPAAGSAAGPRRTTLVLVTGSGDTVRVPIRGEAGTQTLVVSPTSLFDAVTIAVGQTKRQTVMISNTGTLPVRITGIALSGADSASYRIGMMPRRDLEAGQTEYLEVTFVPTAPGQTSAELMVTASNGQSYTVLLGGSALKARRDPNDPATTAAPNTGGTPELLKKGTGTKTPVLR
jgi:hypothetical protein